MGFVTEEIEHDELSAVLTTIEREAGETSEPWRFIELDLDRFERMTPRELRSLGKWLAKEGKRIGREYKSNGAKKASEGGAA